MAGHASMSCWKITTGIRTPEFKLKFNALLKPVTLNSLKAIKI